MAKVTYPKGANKASGATEKDKASLSTDQRKKLKLGKFKNTLSRKGKAAQKLVNKSPKIVGRKTGVY